MTQRTQARLDFGNAGNWNAIEARAREFVDKWEGETYERGESQSFWSDFLTIFGIDRKRAGAFFEYRTRKLSGAPGYVDLFWPGRLVAEQKSAGRDLNRAMAQALDYLPAMPDHELPRAVVVSDFASFDVARLDRAASPAAASPLAGDEKSFQFTLAQLPENGRRFDFLFDLDESVLSEQNPINIKAAQDVSKLHQALQAQGYTGEDLEIFLTRVVFCLFAEDTGIFEGGQFSRYVRNQSHADGTNLGRVLNELFEVLDTADNKRQQNTPPDLAAFPYVNGGLFHDTIHTPMLDSESRRAILTATEQNWAEVNPSIFGSMFQGVMDEVARRNLGAHYTSEKNILRLIQPLFLDDLYAELEKCGDNKTKLETFHQKIANLTFLDPACGSGNFLVITYRELRRLEHKLLQKLYPQGLAQLDPVFVIRVTPDQMAGIELEEFPAKVAELALWLTDHQMNYEAAKLFRGNIEQYARIPIRSQPNIVHANALRIDWGDVVELSNLDYIIGNPPFIGQTWQSRDQKTQVAQALHGIKRTGPLDFVAAWYGKAVDALVKQPSLKAAFVSTNSISQGEQASILWSYLFDLGVRINFAHRTFKWSNDASEVAQVYCVIIGFALQDTRVKRIFDYQTVRAEPVERVAANINQYLLDAPSITIVNRRDPLSKAPAMAWGNKPTDGGHLLLSVDERNEVLADEPAISPYIRPYLGGRELLNGGIRYCIWLVGADPTTVRKSKFLLDRLGRVREFRQKSIASTTRAFANSPGLFRQISQPDSRYLAIPEVSSERRAYIPMSFLGPDVICSNKIQFISDASEFDFGILTSQIHMAWMRVVAGRLKSDYSYSKDIVYNNFPWPEDVTDTQREHIEQLAQIVLDAREAHPTSTLADLYDPLAMPANLRKAHNDLDRAVDRLYRSKPFADDADRVAMLLKMYQRLVEKR